MPYNFFAKNTQSSTVTTCFDGQETTTVTHNNSKVNKAGSLADAGLASFLNSFEANSSDDDESVKEHGALRTVFGAAWEK